MEIMIVTGEASGDGHGAKLVRELRHIAPSQEIGFFGAAGPKLRDAGVEAVVESDELSIVGLLEIGRALPVFLRAFKKLVKAAVERRPDAVVLIDFPEFNLKLSKALKKRGLTVIYYITPQVWAWRKYRAKALARDTDLLLTILPFEKKWFNDNGVKSVEYVGSPLAREVHATESKEGFCARHGLDPTRPIISLLPGSRHKEIIRILPVMLRSMALIAKRSPEAQFILAAAREKDLKDCRDAIAAIDADVSRLKVVVGETYNVLNASDAAEVTSGTATLEAGVIGVPMAIVYKTSKINYGIFMPMISVEHFGLINLIAEKRVVKEMIQDDFTAETVSAEMIRLLDADVNRQVREELRIAAEKLGHGGASKRAAEAILRSIVEKSHA